MDNSLERLYALRAQMIAADLPLDAIDEKIRIEEEKVSSWKNDLDEISSTMKTFIQPIVQKWGAEAVDLKAKYKTNELVSLVLTVDGQNHILCQDPDEEILPMQLSKRMKEALAVTFPDGEEIFEPQASVTLGRAIEKIGPERIMPLQIPALISRNPGDFKAYQTLDDGYYVNTHSNTDTKRRHLEEISRQLGLGLVVRVVPGVYKSRGEGRPAKHQTAVRENIPLLMDELEKAILNISPEFSVDRSLKSYRQFTCNSMYVANVIPRKKNLRIMLNDEYGRLKGLEGVIEAPDAHYGHMNRYMELYNKEGIPTVIEYIIKMLSLPDNVDVPSKIRIRLDK